jgi:N-acetylglucosamine-6-sulfatase
MGPNRPKAAVVLIGTNNTGHLMQSPEEIVVGVERIIGTLQEKSPQTKILLLGVFPRGATPDDPMRVNNDRVNELVSRLDDQRTVFYKNIDDVFLEPDGTISTDVMPDRLHLSAEGYRRWADAIVPTLRDWGVVP